MKYFVVDINAMGTIVSEMLVEKGEFRQIVRVNGGKLSEQAGVIISHILKYRPEKVFVDVMGIGMGIRDSLQKELSEMGFQLLDDATMIY